jgi:RNA polymerase II subunit A-like phosphatase
MSKLKEGVTASEMGGDSNANWSKAEEPESPTAWYMKTDEGDGDEDEDDEDEGIEDDDEGGDSELDDFLARELEEEWG